MINIVSQILDIQKLAEYQEGAVISREIIKKPKGSLTLFAFDKGQGLSEHTAPFDAFVLCLDGKVEITISGKSSVLIADQMIIMPAGEPHSLKAIEKFKMLLVMIRD
jgi:quercetin dioxygenase-like cupin family protein